MSYITEVLGGPPATPASGLLSLYANSTDGLFHSVNSAGLDRPIGKLANVQYFIANATYTPAVSVKAILVKMVGAGGGGGGASNGTAANAASGGGGAAGGYVEYFTSTVNTTYVMTIGVAGAAGTLAANVGTAGANGSNSVFGTGLVTALGGNGGNFSANTLVGGASGGVQTPVSIGGTLNGFGEAGGWGWHQIGTSAMGGRGGSGPLGSGGTEQFLASTGSAALTGAAALGYGAGGGGGVANATFGAAGGIGTQGIIVVLEFA